MADERIVIEIDAETGAVLKQFKKVEGAAKKSGKKSGKVFNDNFTGGISRSLDSVKGKLLALAGIAGTVFGTRFAVRAAAEFEAIEARLQTLTGSAKAASVIFQDLKDFSAQTPFQLGDIANASSKLISFGFSAATVRKRIEEIGEVAAGSGSNINELALIYGQVAAAGKLTGERLLQLQERAIPIGPAIAKSLGIAESSVRDFVSAGKVQFKDFEQAFRSLQEEGGLFAGSLQKQSKTLSGVFSTLSDNAKIFGAELGNTFKPAIIDSAQSLIKIFQELGETIKANGPVLSRTLSSLADTLLITPTRFWLNFFAGDASKNLAEVNSEISKIEKNVRLLNADLAVQQNNAFSKFIGADQETLSNLGEAYARLTELKKIRNELIAQDKTIQSVRSDDLRKFGVVDPAIAKLEADAVRKAEALKEAERAKARQQSLTNLGNVGLQREQIIQANRDRELELIRQAEETKAISQQEADERRLVVNQTTEQQITALKEQEIRKREAARQRALEQELAAEQTLGDILGNTSKRFKDVARDFRVTSKDVAKSLIQGFGNAAGSAFASFGRALATGQDALSAFGDALLQAFGGALIQLGTGFILQGIAQSIAGFGSGAPLIAAGAALATFGGVLSGLGGGGGATSTTGGGVGAVGGSGGFEDDSPVVAQAEEREEPSTQVSVTVQGDILDSQETGTRLVSIINDAFEKDGVVIKGASFA